MKRLTVLGVTLMLYVVGVMPIMAQSPSVASSPLTSPSSATMTSSPSPSSAVSAKAAKLAKAREEMAARLAERQGEARSTLSALGECVKKLPSGSARRGAEKAITNLESAMAKAQTHAAAGEFRRAFLALGRPQKAAAAALKRCSGAAP